MRNVFIYLVSSLAIFLLGVIALVVAGICTALVCRAFYFGWQAVWRLLP